MRRAANIDANQPEIVAALRAVGATVEHLHSVGAGCPDILVGHKGANWLIEIKDGSKAPSKQKLNERQVEWHQLWNGQVSIARTAEEALQIIGVRSYTDLHRQIIGEVE